jgi:two-component system, OmpR family, sensor histidine kinase CssS
MKTLKSKILTPMILLIVLVPVVTLIFFNVGLRIYVQKTARDDLKAAMLPIETLARQELSASSATLTENRLENAAAKLTEAVQSSKLTGGRLLIYNGRDKLAYPKTLPDGFVTSGLVKKIAARLNFTNQEGRVEQIRGEKQTYLMTSYVLSGNAGNQMVIVLVSQQGATEPLFRMMNLILLSIMLVGIGIGVLVTGRISGRVSKHVGQACTATEHIGHGDFSYPKWEETDIAEFRQLSQSILRMSERLQASERSQRDFLQNASHELRTPLMSIQGYAEGILNDIVPDVKKAAEIINSESLRLNALVKELLMLSRIESRTAERKAVKLNLCAALPEFVQRLGGIEVTQKKNITLSLPQEPVAVTADEEILSCAVMNIVSNCLRYAKTKIDVSLFLREEHAVIRVQDDGPGILEEDLPHLFERFYKGKGGNFGLGLAIAKSAVQSAGGKIEACNGETGAIFEITLPCS